MIVELTNLQPSPDLYFTHKLGWRAGDPPGDLDVPGWEDLRFFHRLAYKELGIRGDSIEPISEGKRVRSHATITGELLADSARTPGEWIALALATMAKGISVPR